MKNVVFLFCLLNISVCYASSCFTDDEYKIILQRLDSFKQGEYQDYGNDDFTNIVDCKHISVLSSLICSNPKLENAMLLLSKGEIYGYENATRKPLLDLNYNVPFRNQLNDILKKEKDRNVALRKLCYIVKSRLSDDFGGDFYYSPTVHEIISSKANNDGVVVDTLTRTIYLGNSCDVVTSAKEKGYWYKAQEQLVIMLKEQKYKFNLDDTVLNLNCEQPK